MRLLVDIGNTRVKYVFQYADAPSVFSDVAYCDYQSFKQQLVEQQFASVTEVVVANVHGNDIAIAIEAWALKSSIGFLQVYSEAQAFGVYSSYQQPERLGVDRWLALIAAHQLYQQQNILIIDAGTATTVDLLAANGEHLGGWIMPGVQVMYDSLLKNTTRIIAQPIDSASLKFGMDSSECVNYGIWSMTVGSVKQAIMQANELLAVDHILLTGGNSKVIADLIPENCQLVPELLFHGLSCFRVSK